MQRVYKTDVFDIQSPLLRSLHRRRRLASVFVAYIALIARLIDGTAISD
jgi:hypothetical protein